MKTEKYINPEIEVINVLAEQVFATSPYDADGEDVDILDGAW